MRIGFQKICRQSYPFEELAASGPRLNRRMRPSRGCASAHRPAGRPSAPDSKHVAHPWKTIAPVVHLTARRPPGDRANRSWPSMVTSPDVTVPSGSSRSKELASVDFAASRLTGQTKRFTNS